MNLRIPVPQLNGHPQNHLSQEANNLISWQLRLPPSVYSGDITMDVTSVADIAAIAQLGGLYVLPSGSRGDLLDGYLHSSFDTGLDVTGQDIANNARHNGGSFLFDAARISDGRVATYGCVVIHQDLIQTKLRSTSDRGEVSRRWAEGLNEDFSTHLGQLALENLSAKRIQALLHLRMPTAHAVSLAVHNVKKNLRKTRKNGGLINVEPATDRISLQQQDEDVVYF